MVKGPMSQESALAECSQYDNAAFMNPLPTEQPTLERITTRRCWTDAGYISKPKRKGKKGVSPRIFFAPASSLSLLCANRGSEQAVRGVKFLQQYET